MIADFLTSFGCETTTNDLKNAARVEETPDPNTVPHSPEALGIIDMLRREVPGFEPYGRLLQQGFDLEPDLDTVPTVRRGGIQSLEEVNPLIAVPANDREAWHFTLPKDGVPRRATLVKLVIDANEDADTN